MLWFVNSNNQAFKIIRYDEKACNIGIRMTLLIQSWLLSIWTILPKMQVLNGTMQTHFQNIYNFQKENADGRWP